MIRRLARQRRKTHSIAIARIRAASPSISSFRPLVSLSRATTKANTETNGSVASWTKHFDRRICAEVTQPGKMFFPQHQRIYETASCPFSSSSSSKTSRQESILSSLEGLKESNVLSEETEFSTNPYELDRHGRGESHHRGYLIDEKDRSEDEDVNITPDVIVRPRSVQDVSAILKFCNDARIPVIPYGAGTSVEGHVCAIKNGTISLDMNAFQTIVLPGEEELDKEENSGDEEEEMSLLPDPIARVGAGVTRKALNEALRHTGMQFVVDPGADASLGGMVATGASGTTAVRYGTMRENILELECVLADGTIVKKIGTKALKSSAGYDLLGLMCGSEVSLR